MSLKQHTQTIFRQQFDRESDITIKAPGRVNLIGEHTDYNDGFVLPCAINYETVISCGKRDDRQIRVIAADYENQQDIFSLDAPIVPHPEYRWADYVRGVVKHLQMRNADLVGPIWLSVAMSRRVLASVPLHRWKWPWAKPCNHSINSLLAV